MKKQMLSLITVILTVILSLQTVGFAASVPPSYEQRVEQVNQNRQESQTNSQSTPPPRPVVGTGETPPPYSLPVSISFEDSTVTIPMDIYHRNNPYKAYYTVVTDGEGEPRLSLCNPCDNGYSVYSMTYEEDSRGTYIAIHPEQAAQDRVILSNPEDESVSDTLYLVIVESLNPGEDTFDVITPPREEVDLSQSGTNPPNRPWVDLSTLETDTEEEDTEEDFEEEEEPPVAVQDPFTDVSSSHRAYEAICALKEAGVVNGYLGGKFMPDAHITRAEAASMMIHMLKDPEGVSIQGNPFVDVTAHWGYDVIAKAKNLAIIDGVDQTHFFPDHNITDEQTVKIVVCLLGYRQQAERLGGYPHGYIAVAKEIGLLNQVENFTISQFTTRANLAQMLYNALTLSQGGSSEYPLISLSEKNPSITPETPKHEVNVPKEPAEQKPSVSTPPAAVLEDDAFAAVRNSFPYVTADEATVLADFIRKAVKNGWNETPEIVREISEYYFDTKGEVILEELSDIYMKLQ